MDIEKAHRLSARIRALRRGFCEYTRTGLSMSGSAVDALCERLRAIEIDAETAKLTTAPKRRVRDRLPVPTGPSELGRRYGQGGAR